MSHKFDPRNLARLDNPERKKTLPPEEILRILELKTGETFLDIGAGTGYFSLPASAIVGDYGLVIATDIAREMTEELSSRAAASGRKNILVRQTGEYETGTEPSTVDLAFFCNVIHEIEDKNRMLRAVHDTLKPGGRIGIVEWKKIPTPAGPPLSERISEDEMTAHLNENGYGNILVSDIRETYQLYTALK